VDSAQSNPLQILVTGGVVGGFFVVVGFVALLVVLLRRWKAQRHREERALTLAGVGALLAILLDGLVEFNLGAAAVPATAACIIGLALAAGDGSPREQPAAPRAQ
jgi:O-antigen ligase